MKHKTPLDYLPRGIYHIAMRRRHILTIFCFASMVTVDQDSAISQDRDKLALANAIVLFGAHWCAPCRGEYRAIPALVAAAAPNQVVLAWVDRSIAPPSGIVPANGVLDVLDAQALAARIGGEGYGLPFSAMFDSDSRVCSVWRRPLRPDDIKTLKSACRHQNLQRNPTLPPFAGPR
ncbi:MAG: hypothetical protein M3N34_07555 [Pseudomonadota bacterium]|nr:hypothetical protein [Pseudomonadota bacterium]